MSQKVIVLTPDEWNDRTTLTESLKTAYNHTHFAVTRTGDAKAAVYGIMLNIKQGKSKVEIAEDLEALISRISDITTEIRMAQTIISSIKNATSNSDQV